MIFKTERGLKIRVHLLYKFVYKFEKLFSQ